MSPRDMDESVAFQLGSIQNALETITRTLSENRTADAQYRTGVREEMTRQRDAILKVQSEVERSAEVIAEIKPKVTTLEERALMSAGAAKLAIILGKFAHIISAAVGGAIVLVLDRLVFHR